MTRHSAPADAPYTLRHIEEMLGLGRGVVAGLIGAGFVTPARGTRNELRFTFQDVVLLRTAYHLRAADIAPRKMLRALRQLRARLPDALPLSGLRIRAIGSDVAVREGNAQWEAESGQLLMDFEVAPSARGSVAFLPRDQGAAPGPAPPADLPAPAAPPDAAAWFLRGQQLEDAGAPDLAAAEQAYRQALALEPQQADAWLNLGALLCEAGRCEEAVRLYDQAIRHCPDVALLHYNRAIALEDRQRDTDALVSYERCLALAPELADAHYNAARLHEKRGNAQRALRHYSAYKRLARQR